MDIILYICVFLIGITFGSFISLAIYRIPLREDITHTRSYCPKCNHKLSFKDLIPVFSYIFLGGKCRYCHEKIRIRYFLLEIFSGMTFVLFAMSIKFNIYTIDISKSVYLIFGLLYIVGLFIIAGIDKEKHQIQNQVLLYVVLIEALYIIYLCIIENANVYRYIMYLFIILALIVANNLYFSKKAKNSYVLEILILIFAMSNFTYETCMILTIAFTLLAVSSFLQINRSHILNNMMNKSIRVDKDKIKKIEIPFGFYLSVTNIIMLITTNTLIFYRG